MDYLRSQIRQQGGNPENMDQLLEAYANINPSEPLWREYLNYMVSIHQGNFGESLFHSGTVGEILADAVPWTVFLMTISILSIYIIGITLGAVMAYYESGLFDNASSVIAIVSNSIPYYVVALVFLFFFGFDLGWFPTVGRANDMVDPGLTFSFLAGVLNHAFLPAISLVLTSFGGIALAMRGNSIRVLGEDYIRVAHLRGLGDKRVAIRYVGRNSILPLYTSFLISVGYLFGGSVVLETIFRYQGLGFYLFEAISTRDYPLMMGGFIMITVAVVIAMLIGDLTYGMLDPRAEQGGSHESY
ncbi:ABC transporter permease [Halomontanus rarus]|uniref:ABC transporter permease n=1 Tax=Halomontanus rarus TaxID=3034020 RepID=UPI0023E7DAB3|nr:ABC transporter permease [Halovivax sp. TS33]